ncbi:hypothetical protein ABW21_db0209309 [Orbilia brochopaga]|nr:hypothetical protein ABW21_db0209309 [Drechslerella brochopaga]
MDIAIVQPELTRPARPYLKLKDMEIHKSFILGLRASGVRIRAILSRLESERGVTLGIHKLKRMLQKWDGSKQNLTKKRVQNIRHEIRKRQGRGKQTHKVVLSRSGRELTQQEIMDAMKGVSPGYMHDVKLYAEDAIVLSTPTPKTSRGDNETDCESDIELPDLGSTSNIGSEGFDIIDNGINNGIDDGINDENDDDNDDENDDENHDEDSNGMSDGDVNVTDAVHSFVTLPHLQNRGVTSPEENTEILDDVAEILISQGQKEKDSLAKVAEAQAASSPLRPEDTDEEITEVLSAGFGEMILTDTTASSSECSDEYFGEVSAESQGLGQWDLSIEEPVVPNNDVQHETLLGEYARRHRHLLWAWIEEWENETMKILDAVTVTSETEGVSLLEATETVWLEFEERWGREPLPYHIYKQILGEDADGGTASSATAVVEGVDGDLLCRIVEDNFAVLENAVSQLPLHHHSRLNFDSSFAHLPYIVSKYGLKHFYTAYALNLVFDILRYILEDLKSDYVGNTTLASALCIYNSIGMGADHWAIDCCGLDSSNIEHRLAVAYGRAQENTRKAVLQRYGPNHPQSLQLYSRLAYRTFLTPGLRQQGELMAYGIFHTIKATYRIYSDTLKTAMIVCFRTIGEIFLHCARADLAACILAEPTRWEIESSPYTADPLWNCNFLIGQAFAGVGRYKDSLQALFRCFNIYRGNYDINHQSSLRQIEKITSVMDRRGPVLYTCLDPTFDKLLRSLERAGKAKARAYQQLQKARKRCGVDTQQYVNMLATTSMNLDSQDFWYSQGLDCWLAHQEVPLAVRGGGGGGGLGGWVEEIDPSDIWAD